jgi:uncharacterized protein YdeI (YjbR/CyaY-like superfamily)
MRRGAIAGIGCLRRQEYVHHRVEFLQSLHYPDARDLAAGRFQREPAGTRSVVDAYDRSFVNPKVDAYVARSTKWPIEIERLRLILLRCGLTEELKWGKPCYSSEGRNIAILQEMKDFLALMFFKGALLSDPLGVLEAQGPNSRSALRIRFTSVDDVTRLADAVTALVNDAIRVEDLGLQVPAGPELMVVDELAQRLVQDNALKVAFEALTPGRQREYNLYFSDAKQASTRQARIDKFVDKILDGKGMRD